MSKRTFEIAGNKIGEFTSPFIIAEAGVNHNGDLGLALQLVEAAAAAGADCVKFQTFQAKQVVTDRGEMATYQKKNTGVSKSQLAMLKELELKEEFYGPIIEHCRKHRILFLSTPHGGVDSVNFLESLNLAAYKIGSGDLTNYLLLDKIARLKKPIILSSGMATMAETKAAIDFIRSRKNNKIIVLHCTSNYPCPPDEVNLAAMRSMMQELDVLVGYSDHTLGSQVAIMAVTLGAALYECHFTLDKKMKGPDHAASADPKELKDKITKMRLVATIMGDKKKRPNHSEAESMITTVRRSLVAKRDLPIGHVLTLQDLEAKRPGDGLSPIYFEKVLGKKLKKSLKPDEQINLENLE